MLAIRPNADKWCGIFLTMNSQTTGASPTKVTENFLGGLTAGGTSPWAPESTWAFDWLH